VFKNTNGILKYDTLIYKEILHIHCRQIFKISCYGNSHDSSYTKILSYNYARDHNHDRAMGIHIPHTLEY
jgi:hypothetical protein